MLSLNFEIAFDISSAAAGRTIGIGLFFEVADAIEGFFPARFDAGTKSKSIAARGSLAAALDRAASDKLTRISGADASQAIMTISGSKNQLSFHVTLDMDTGVDTNSIENAASSALRLCVEQDLSMRPFCLLAVLGTAAGNYADKVGGNAFFPEALLELVPLTALAAIGIDVNEFPSGSVVAKGKSQVLLDWTLGKSDRSRAVIEHALLEKRAFLLANGGNESKQAAEFVKFDIGSPAPHAKVSLYDPLLQRAYLTVHESEPANEIDAKVKNLQGWLTRGEIDAKSPLLEAFLIVSSLKFATSLVSRAGPHIDILVAKEDGLERVG